MAIVTPDQVAPPEPIAVRRASRFNRWDSPWLNTKFVSGLVMVLAVLLMGLVGGRFWNERLALVASSPETARGGNACGALASRFAPPS